MLYLEYIILKMFRELCGLFGKNWLYRKFCCLCESCVYSKINRLDVLADYYKNNLALQQHYGYLLPVEFCWNHTGHGVKIVTVKLRELKHVYGKGGLENHPLYLYLKYKDTSVISEQEQKYMDKLLKSIKKNGYKPGKMLVLLNKNKMLLDGNHKACCLYYLYGPYYEITCAIYTDNRRY